MTKLRAKDFEEASAIIKALLREEDRRYLAWKIHAQEDGKWLVILNPGSGGGISCGFHATIHAAMEATLNVGAAMVKKINAERQHRHDWFLKRVEHDGSVDCLGLVWTAQGWQKRSD